MRKPLILAAFVALLPALPASAQTAQRGTAQRAAQRAAPLTLTTEQRATLEAAVTHGRALAVLDQAARTSTQDMLTRLPNPNEAGIAGWVAEPEGNGVTVTYYGRDGDAYTAIYTAQVIGGRVSSPQINAAGNRPALTGTTLRMAQAREAAGAVDKPACGPDLNAIVLPPVGNDPILVYRLSPRMAANRLPAGGHYRFAIAADGSIAEEASLGTATCTDIALPAVAAGQRPAPLRINAAGSQWPNELHVFIALSSQRPVVVATGGEPIRLWGVTGEGIAELQQ